ncbi:hypothetical protein [Natrialba taiwanensis]|uniref:Uncharacterized protein n=1 Tax=Natrialba taiwanensis DSM 12281 TaxID=1230458 RepID=L9ZZF7_9EURY|nr:hypothetical protein [Natrialba taiwanensis]ELY91456.1 hypothetical protein C484_10526 [Natrialba taiwanensis DSM 12281]
MKSEKDIPNNVSNMKRALEDGRCFMAQFRTRRHYYEFVEDIGWIKTETDGHGRDPSTLPASNEDFQTALRFADIVEIDSEDAPVNEDDTKDYFGDSSE